MLFNDIKHIVIAVFNFSRNRVFSVFAVEKFNKYGNKFLALCKALLVVISDYHMKSCLALVAVNR